MATQVPFNGLNLDAPSHQMEQGDYTYALNATDEAYKYALSKERSSYLRSRLPAGFKPVGVISVIPRKQTYFFLHNPKTGQNRIGYLRNDIAGPPFETVLDAPCLNFSLQHPILKPRYAISRTGKLTLFFTDNHNPPRFYEVGDAVSGAAGCEALRMFPSFAVPAIGDISVEEGGELRSGVYQFAVAYADERGNALSPYYAVSNPIAVYGASLADFSQAEGDAPGTNAGKSVRLTVSGLDTRQPYYNLAVIETSDAVSSYRLIATFATGQSRILFTGRTQSDISLSEILAVKPFYERAGDVELSNEFLMWADLETQRLPDLQKIASGIRLDWQTERWNHTRGQNYANPRRTTQRGFMRDEVYPFAVVFILASGRYSPAYHIPGRAATPDELEAVAAGDPNFVASAGDGCTPDVSVRQRWEIYNTASKTGLVPEYDPADDCYDGGHEYGRFAYWQSSEFYPDDADVWGALAGTPIRHHRFPDSRVTHHHDGAFEGTEKERLLASIRKTEDYIHPIGVRVDEGTVIIPPALQDTIVGYKIVRGNRVGNKSVVAKGLLYNCWEYVDISDEATQNKAAADDEFRKSITHLFANYPYNDLRPNYDFVDIFATEKVDEHPDRPVGYDNDGQPLAAYRKNTFTFHSPDTHFGQPTLGSLLKIEANLTGHSLGSYQPVAGHARFDPNNVNPDGGSQRIGGIGNVAKTYKSYGDYNGYALPPDSLTLRRMTDAVYLRTNARQVAGSIGTVNHVFRESAVALQTGSDVDDPAVTDRSRWTHPGRPDLIPTGRSHRPYAPFGFDTLTNPDYWLALRRSDLGQREWLDDGAGGNPWENQDDVETHSTVSSWYVSLKRSIPNQYGDLYSVEYLDTGHARMLAGDEGRGKTVFGGDIFIGRFSLKRKVNFFPKENGIGRENLKENIFEQRDNAYVFRVRRHVREKDGLNNDGYWLSGRNMTLFSYGIPHFFAESEYNTELRHSDSRRESEYWPKIRSLTFNQYLEEIIIPIERDNVFLYNNNYSKQNNESPFVLPPLAGTVDSDFPSRVVYSDPGRYRLYRDGNRYDFPETKGRVTALHGIENNQILALFENGGMAVYNAVITLSSNSPQRIEAGDAGMFAARPVEIYQTGYGYGSSQHKAFASTEFGHFYADAARGQVFQFAQSSNEISAMKAAGWFKRHLPIRLLEHFPDAAADNALNGAGISIAYDPFHKRVLLSKRDYVPVVAGITHRGGVFRLAGKEIDLDDTRYFCPVGWTIAYNPLKKRWVSFYSYVPQAFISQPTHFQTLIGDAVHDHPGDLRLLPKGTRPFGVFGGREHPFILEVMDDGKTETEVLSSLTVVADAKDHADVRFPQPARGAFFDELTVYNDYQGTGVLKLSLPATGDMRSRWKRPPATGGIRHAPYSFQRDEYAVNALHDVLNPPVSRGQRIWSADENDAAFRAAQPVDRVFLPPDETGLPAAQRRLVKNPVRGKFVRSRWTSRNAALDLVVKFITFVKQKAF